MQYIPYVLKAAFDNCEPPINTIVQGMANDMIADIGECHKVLESALSQANMPPAFNLYTAHIPQPSMKDLHRSMEWRVKAIERQAQFDSLVTRTSMHARQDTDLLSPTDLTQRR